MSRGWPSVQLASVVSLDALTATPADLSDDDLYIGLDNIGPNGELIGLGDVRATSLRSNKNRFASNDVLFGKLRPYLAKVARPTGAGVCSTDILVLRPSDALDRNYLYWWLRSPAVIQDATARSTGATLPRISPSTLGEFEIPVPPLAEQQRIVAKLGELDADLRTLSKCLDAELLRSAQVRLSVMDEIFAYRPSYETEGAPAMSEQWEEVSFAEAFVVSPKNTQTLPRSAYKDRGQFRVVDQGEGLIGGWTDDPALVKTFDRPVIVFGDHTRCLKFIDFPFAPGADGIKVLIPANFLVPRFAYYQLLASPVEVKGYARHYGELKTRQIKVPPLAEQRRIVAKLDQVMAGCAEVSENIERRRTKAGELRQSVLAAAFRGEL